MTKMRYSAALFALLGFLPALSGHDDTKELRDLMQRELKASQRVLEGIALNNFEQIARNGEELILISKDAEWKVLKTPMYELHSNEFRRNAEGLIRAAKDRNLDGATLAYVDMTLNCVKCHRYVREVRMTRRQGEAGSDGVGQ
jgi:hypothetical protein